MEGDRFCTRCGAMLPDGAAFCPECGSPLDGGFRPEQQPQYGYGVRTPVRRCPGFVILFLLYGVFALILGALDAVNALGYDEATYNELIRTMEDMTGYDMTGMLPVWTSDLPVMMCLSMAFLAISGALAVGTYYFCRVRSDWRTAVIMCVASSVACLGMMCSPFYMSLGILLFAVGLVFTIILYSSKRSFGAARWPDTTSWTEGGSGPDGARTPWGPRTCTYSRSAHCPPS